MRDDPSSLFAALGHRSRLAIFRLLARRAPQGVPAGEIAEVLGIAPNTASAHLAGLSRASLIFGRRDGKQILYSLDIANAARMIDYLLLDCCRGRPDLAGPAAERPGPARQTPLAPESTMPETRPYNVLFICSGNSARSIFAEALLTELGEGKFNAYSAGVKPDTQLNPYAIAKLEKLGHDVSKLRSKHISEFQQPGAPVMDFVFTVCDKAANEECPPWPGKPISGHWGTVDPVKATGTDAEKALAFSVAYRELHHRISAFAALPIASLDRIALQQAVDDIAAAPSDSSPVA